MALAAGARIGPYEVLGSLGAGGMGEVYRARDGRLGREVALKILPEDVAGDPERLARFEREAQVLASLNHPHIAAIYGLEHGPASVPDGAAAPGGPGRALVLELVDGETLADAIRRGPMPERDVVRIARQIAEALEAAHEQGIVHRDLKPANIKITTTGVVKVLDFGLAKLTGPPGAAGSAAGSLSMSPTMMSPAMLTGATTLIGTASYMAPEQARGRPADKRADIWAFGVVLYEMLTGARAFEGESVTEVIGAVIHKDPDWTALPAAISPSLRMILERCLQRDPRQRFRDMGDVRLALDGAFTIDPPRTPEGSRVGTPSRLVAGAAAAAVLLASLAAAGVWLAMRGGGVEARTPLRFDVAPARPGTLAPLVAISPDARMLAFVALDPDGVPRLFLRSFETGETRPLVPTDLVRQPPFWSPDSRSVAFFADNRLKRVDVTGGPAETIAEIGPGFGGGSWGRGGDIVYSIVTAIMRVPAAGGEPVAVTRAGREQRVNAHLLPHFLPDGRRFLYLVFGDDDPATGIYAASIDAAPEEQPQARVFATGQNVAYAAASSGPGHLLFVRDGLLMAQPFDSDRLETTGDAMPVAADRIESNSVLATFSASANGTLVYRRGGASEARPALVDRRGTMTPLFSGTPLDGPGNPRVSPDGRRLALIVGGDLWIDDLQGRPPIRLTFSPDASEYSPIWTGDGQRIVFEQGGGDDDGPTLFAVAADGSGGEPEPVSPAGHFHPHGWTADGEIVAGRIANNRGDLVQVAPRPDGVVRELAATSQSEGYTASVSPDGRWVAYASESTGRAEIWVRPLSRPGAPVRVSPDGGTEPVWSRDGRELFYTEDGKLMMVQVSIGQDFDFMPPVELFTTTIIRGQQPPSYDVTPDGAFVMMVTGDDADYPLSVIVNWPEVLRPR